MSEAAAPAAPQPAAAPAPDRNVGTLTDRLASKISDADFEDLLPDEAPPAKMLDVSDFDDDDEGDDDDTSPERPARKTPVPKEPEPRDPAKTKAAPAPKEAPPEPKAAKSPLPLDRGTEEKPYGVNDLPADRFVKLKIDGKETTLPMRELADGYIRKQTFDSTLSKAKQAIVDAERIAKGHIEERTKLRGDLETFLGDDDRVFNHLLNRDPDMLLRLGARIGTLYGEWSKDPLAKDRFMIERDRQRLAAERQRDEQQRQQRDQDRQRSEVAEANRARWAPIWQEALKEAGFPKMTHELADTIQAFVAVAEKRGNGKIDVPTFKAIVARAAKAVGAETVNGRQPPAPSTPEPRDPVARIPRNEKKWEGMSHAEKFRDPDYILRRRR